MQPNPKKSSRTRREYPAPPEGTRKLFTRWVAKIGGSRAAAEQLGISRSYVDMMKSGTRSPGLHTAHRIAHYTSGEIPMDAWLRLPGRLVAK